MPLTLFSRAVHLLTSFTATNFFHQGGYSESRDTKFRTRPVSVIRKGKWKLLQFFEEYLLDGGWDQRATNNSIELHDLENDIGEQGDLADPVNQNYNPTKRDELLTDLIAWQESINAPNGLSEMPE